MHSRHLPLLLSAFLLVSVALATPTEGSEDFYQDGDLLEDLIALVPEVFGDPFPEVEPYLDGLQGRHMRGHGTVQQQTTTNGIVLPTALDQQRQQPVATPLQYTGDLQPSSYNAGPAVASQQPAAYDPDMAANAPVIYIGGMTIGQRAPRSPTDDNGLHNAMLDDLAHPPDQIFNLDDQRTAQWAANTYAPGDRIYAVGIPQDQLTRYQQHELPHMPHQQPYPITPQLYQAPATTHQQYFPGTPQPEQTQAPAQLRCNHPDCNFTTTDRSTLSHHGRVHIPMAERRHGCDYCDSRFNYPREVRRHQVVHGMGPRYPCPHPSCPYAADGFGRPDHLSRHVRNIHGTEPFGGEIDI